MSSHLGNHYLATVSEAKLSLHAFVVGSVAAFVPAACLAAVCSSSSSSSSSSINLLTLLLCIIVGIVSCFVIGCCLTQLALPMRRFPHLEASGRRAAGLGCGFACGCVLVVYGTGAAYWQFGAYFMFLCAFHWSEYFVTAVANPATLKISSYILDHSVEYYVAASISWLEFWVEFGFLGGMKHQPTVAILGITMCTAGELIRKCAMITAGTNFNHVIEHRKRVDHQLVTHGVYKLARHPSYTGWFLWAVGTQLILCNPISLIGYTIVTWRFFSERILEEERLLINFFKQSYIDYQRSVWSGIPLVSGYLPGARGDLSTSAGQFGP